MGKISRLIKFLFIYVPITILNGIRVICFENVNVEEVFFEVSKPKKKAKGISKQTKRKIITEYLNDCFSKSDD